MNLTIKKLIQRKKAKQRGATAVELAIVLIIFITIIFGTIEFGLFMYNQHIVTEASREGARQGIVYRQDDRISESDIKATVNSYVNQYVVTFGGGAPEVDVVECVDSGDFLSVDVKYNYNFLFLRHLQREINSKTRMRCE